MERFWSKVDKRGPHECWPWLASLSGSGYGQFKLKGHMVRAHRVAYELAVGPIPPGLTLDHLCRNLLCCNPNHLEPSTLKENILRSDGLTAINARKTWCKHGHEFTEQNTIIAADGSRHCRACKRLSDVEPKPCDLCGKEIARSNLPRHRRNIHGVDSTAIRE